MSNMRRPDCFIVSKKIIYKAYYGEDVYIHIFLNIVAVSPCKKHRYVLNMTHDVRVSMEGLDRCLLAIKGQRNTFVQTVVN